MNKMLLLLAAFLLLNTPLVLADDSADITGALTEYYDAGKAEDVDRYVAAQDTAFLEIVGGKDYKAYFSAAFKETDVLSYELVKPQVIIVDESQAFMFYELEAEVTMVGTGETVDIDNSMAAAFWKYDDSWKVRYTMLRSVFDAKVEADVFGEAAAAMMVYVEDNTTMKQQFVDEGKLRLDEESLGKPKGGGFGKALLWIAVVGVLAVAGFFANKRFGHQLKKRRRK
jgi:hypothetical protein